MMCLEGPNGVTGVAGATEMQVAINGAAVNQTGSGNTVQKTST